MVCIGVASEVNIFTSISKNKITKNVLYNFNLYKCLSYEFQTSVNVLYITARLIVFSYTNVGCMTISMI